MMNDCVGSVIGFLIKILMLIDNAQSEIAWWLIRFYIFVYVIYGSTVTCSKVWVILLL